MPDLDWLPERADWNEILTSALEQAPQEAFTAFQVLANSRMDFIRAGKLDRAVRKYVGQTEAHLPVVRLALLGSSTLTHLVPGIRLGCLRRGFLAEIYEGPYGMFLQELSDPSSGVHQFQPDAILFVLDACNLAGAETASVEGAIGLMRQCWSRAKQAFHCAVIQQTVLPVFAPTMGNNEHRYGQSPLAIVNGINTQLREAADAEGVHLLSVDRFALEDGLSFWHDARLWHRSKQEVHPRAGSLYGDQVGRLIASIRGKSYKCLVLDLDNTLWGGVIGDDGLEGIILGQGNAVGEAHIALQNYARRLARRGVILAVCSKNDEHNALSPFESHPEMVLKRAEIAAFVANWEDKASNIRTIAQTLNIGLDSIVFVDDNPMERGLVRRELPMVAVPELPEDPADYVGCLARAGYFEGLSVTAEDMERGAQYQANAERDKLRAAATDLAGFMEALRMELIWNPFDTMNFSRIVQLINKTNQFNLTTQRYADAEVQSIMADAGMLTLQFRLTDIYGDNGIIGLLIGRQTSNSELVMDTWLMSCRVLGRQVEEAMLNVLVDQASERGIRRILGQFKPTPKNGMVREHYKRLGFELVRCAEDGQTWWSLDLSTFKPFLTRIATRTINGGINEAYLQSTH
jgi:FkbH-like protein